MRTSSTTPRAMRPLEERIALGGRRCREYSPSSSPASARCPRSSTSRSTLGTEDQLPDPTIESYEVAGTVPGFRGLAYIVFNDFQLAKYGNRIPNFRFEVYSGTPTECGLYSAGNLEPWQFQSTRRARPAQRAQQSRLRATPKAATIG